MEGEEPPKRPAQDWADFVDTSRKWQRAFIFLIVALVLVAAVGAYFYKHKSKSQKTTTTIVNSQSVPTKISAETKSYTSPNFYLSLNYPKDWTLTDSGGGTMTIISPAIELTNSNGQKLTGQVVLTFRDKSRPLPEFDKGNAVAALDSQKIAYAHPSQAQRASTYVSFLTYAGSASGGIDGIYITSDSGYKAGQAIPKVDVRKVDPIISLTFSKCAESTCSTKGSPLSIAASEWKHPQLSNPLTKMLESLTIT